MAGGARSSIVLLGDRQGEAGERRDRALLGSELDLLARMLRELLARLLALDFVEGSLRLVLRELGSAAHAFASGLSRPMILDLRSEKAASSWARTCLCRSGS